MIDMGLNSQECIESLRKKMKTIYLAGPDVFEQDAIAQGERLKTLCRVYGFEGLYPLDNAIEFYATPQLHAEAIRKANIELIKKADIVMANLNPFRGFEPDSGTVYEVGFAEALGKRVVAYAYDRRAMIERLREVQKLPQDALQCQDGKIIEDFSHSHNLMLSHTIVASNPESCLQLLQRNAQD